MDCWTFFEIALSLVRMLHEPETNWTPEQLCATSGLTAIEVANERSLAFRARVPASYQRRPGELP